MIDFLSRSKYINSVFKKTDILELGFAIKATGEIACKPHVAGNSGPYVFYP